MAKIVIDRDKHITQGHRSGQTECDLCKKSVETAGLSRATTISCCSDSSCVMLRTFQTY